MVRASGAAKRDQSLYLGTYRRISNYNGHYAYEYEGKEQLFIYYYSSPVRPPAKCICSNRYIILQVRAIGNKR